MAEYVPLHQDGEAITRSSSAAITAGQLVSVSGSGTVAPSGAGDTSWLGVAGYDVSGSGFNVTIYRGGVQRIVAGSGGVTAGSLVQAGASGTVVNHVNGTNDSNIVGVALTTATATNLAEIALR